MSDRDDEAYLRVRKRIAIALEAVAVFWVSSALIHLLHYSAASARFLTFTGFLAAAIAATDGVSLLILTKRINSHGMPCAAEATEPSDEFALVTVDGEKWYERRVLAQGKLVVIRVSSYSKSQKATFDLAARTIASLDITVTTLTEFITAEKPKFSRYYNDLENLRLKSVTIMSPYESDTMEFDFHASESGRNWSCSYKDDAFFDLGFDD